MKMLREVKIGVTLGDPAGIGYEISVKALLKVKKSARGVKFLLFGSEAQLSKVVKLLQLDDSVLIDGNDVVLVDVGGGPVEFGKVSEEAGRISYSSFAKAVDMALRGDIDAIVTAPINKEAWKLAGVKYIDHTSALKELTGVKEVMTVFEVGKLRINFLTKHVSLAEAVRLIKKDLVIEGIRSSLRALRLLGVKNGSIAVAALNPHAGEGGLLGDEEIKEIKPAIDEFRRVYNYDKVYGPIPADSVFYLASQGLYDIVLSLYHDQGHIAAKTCGFKETVSLNLGAPFLRTSVDHGTAFDIAGKGLADETNMVKAIERAIAYAKTYRENYAEEYKNFH